ncbi:MAG: hypothetical protein PUE71_08835 [Clostridia bacterium]|nr:hypothetical protein [Clostridia bacterium]
MISSAYSYYLSQYGSRQAAKYDTSARKPSDVKRSYNKMLQLNRTTPTYKTDLSVDAQKYAIDLKENARELSNIASELSGDNSSDMILRQSAVSDNPDTVTAKYSGNSSSNAKAFDVSVHQLATPQINTSNYLPPASKLLTPGDYSFDLNISDITYEFEFGVNENDTSKSIQEKISRLINRSNIDLESSVINDSMGNTALLVKSKVTGINGLKPVIFDIQDNHTEAAETTPAVATLGLNRISQYPSNAVYSIDGNERTSPTNTVMINNAFELTFHRVQEEPPVSISLKADSDAAVDSINELITGYNNLISVATDDTRSSFSGSDRLKRQFTSLSHAYSSLLSSSGLDVNDNGSITVNADSIKAMVENNSLNSVFENLGKFKEAIQDTAEKIAMNPMDYVNNKIIAYKNPHRVTTDPYNLSAYTGMMFNGYI